MFTEFSHHTHHCETPWNDCEDPRMRILHAMAGRLRGHGGHGHGHHGGPSGFDGRGFPPDGGRFPMGDMFWSFFGRGQRARRGDVRVAILALLAEKPYNGYQIIQELEQRSQGVWRPSPGSVYPTFQQLEDERLVTTSDSGSGRVYCLTELGKTYVKEHEDEVREPWAFAARAGSEVAHQQLHEVLDELRQIWAAAAQVARAGNPTQVERAAKLLGETRRALYRILAEDDK